MINRKEELHKSMYLWVRVRVRLCFVCGRTWIQTGVCLLPLSVAIVFVER